MTRLAEAIDTRDVLERTLRGLRGDLRAAAGLRDSTRCGQLRTQIREVEAAWSAACRNVVALRGEAAQSPRRWTPTITLIG
jgi:hypothetical protein